MGDYLPNSDDEQRDLLKRMVLIREFENRASNAFLDAEFPGTLHLCVGQEGSAVGVVGPLESDDQVVTTHRGHGHELAKGIDVDKMMAELFGKAAGYNSGKGGSQHVAHEASGLMGGNPIVGASFPLATGAGLAAKYQGEDYVGVGVTGDGGIAQGQTHEAMNLAATWDLPVIYVVENNKYGETTPVERQHNVEELSKTAAAYDIPGYTIDGMDVETVYETVSEARERALAGSGPTLIETDVCRYESHSEGHATPYRSDGEVDEYRENRDRSGESLHREDRAVRPEGAGQRQHDRREPRRDYVLQVSGGAHGSPPSVAVARSGSGACVETDASSPRNGRSSASAHSPEQ